MFFSRFGTKYIVIIMVNCTAYAYHVPPCIDSYHIVTACIPYSGKFSRVNIFAEWLERASEEMFVVRILILCFNAKKPHPPHMKYRKYCVWEFLPVNFRMPALPSKNVKICTTRNFPYSDGTGIRAA